MRSQKHFRRAGPLGPLGIAVGAGLLGLAAFAISPRLYGGGGDEGVDILPAGFGPTGGSALDGPPKIGFVAIHGERLSIDPLDVPVATGFLVGNHSRADVFIGLPGNVPDTGEAAIDLITRGKRKLGFSELVENVGGTTATSLHFNGRFQVEDLDALDGEKLEMVALRRQPSVLAVMIGHRSTHEGGIRQSFDSVAFVAYQNLPEGGVDLVAAREAANAAFAGSGYDIGLTLYARAMRGLDEVTVAWNADDARAIYDVEVRLR